MKETLMKLKEHPEAERTFFLVHNDSQSEHI